MGARGTGEGVPIMIRKVRPTTRRRSYFGFALLVKMACKPASRRSRKAEAGRRDAPFADSAVFLGSVRDVGITCAIPAISARAWMHSKLERALLTELLNELLRRVDRAATPGGAAAATFREIPGGRYVSDPFLPVAPQRKNVR
jgi:hypothetical protein